MKKLIIYVGLMIVLVSCAHNKSKRAHTPNSGPPIHKEVNVPDSPINKIQLPKEDKSDFYTKWALSTGTIAILAYKFLITKGLI